MPKSRPGTLAYPENPLLPRLCCLIFSRLEERRRLSAAALKALFNIVNHWKVRDEDARELLGGISNGNYYQLKKKPSHPRQKAWTRTS